MRGDKTIETIVFTAPVLSVMESSFSEVDNLRKVVFLGKLENIDHYAFSQCMKLEEIIFCDDIDRLFCCFVNNPSLHKIVWPSVIGMIFDSFNNCPNLPVSSIPFYAMEIGGFDANNIGDSIMLFNRRYLYDTMVMQVRRSLIMEGYDVSDLPSIAWLKDYSEELDVGGLVIPEELTAD